MGAEQVTLIESYTFKIYSDLSDLASVTDPHVACPAAPHAGWSDMLWSECGSDIGQDIDMFSLLGRTLTTVFVDTRLWKTKHPRKRFENSRQSCVLLTDRIEIHQLQPLVWPSNLLCVMLSDCDWWISIRSVNNTQDWRKFWKRFLGCCDFQSRVSTKAVVKGTARPRDLISRVHGTHKLLTGAPRK